MSTSPQPTPAWPFQKAFEDFFSRFVYFPTTNWQRTFSPQINFGCNLEDLDTEQHVLDKVGSYGYQLSRIIDVLNALVARLPAGGLTLQERQDVKAYHDMVGLVQTALEEKQGPASRGVTAGDVAKLASGLKALANTDHEQYRALLDQLHAALPDLAQAENGLKKPE